jgi:2-phospho-L-lactate guanylyltransferase
LKLSAQAKTRLAGVLSEKERVELVRDMARHVVSILQAVPDIADVFVMTRNRQDVPLGARWLEEVGSDVNEALASAASLLEDKGIDRVVIVAGDLPYLSTDDVKSILTDASGKSVVIATNEAAEGSNALLLSPPTVIQPRFGGRSLAAHEAAAAAAAAPVHVIRRPGLAMDIDTPEDLARWHAGPSRTA